METLQIITTVGASMFENYKQTYLNGKQNISNAFDKLKNAKALELDYSNSYVVALIGDDEEYGIQAKYFKGHVSKKQNEWYEINDKNLFNTHASAEISSIIKIAKDENTNYKVHLLASDTVLSILSAKLIQEWFQQARIDGLYKNIEVLFNDNVKSEKADYIPNLRTDGLENELFEGFNNLIKKVLEISKDKKENTIINITGGYKGFIPVLTIIAQIEGLKINYLYEDSDKLIEIGKFPVSFDVFIAETYHYYIEETKNLKYLDATEKQKLIDLSLITDNNEITAIGRFFLDYLKNVDFSRDTLGHYYEHKLFYQLFEKKVQQLENYTVEKLGVSFDSTIGKEGEIDLILNSDNGKCFIEVKSYNKAAKNSTKVQIEKYISYAKEKGISLNKIVLFIYKFDFQNWEQKRKLLIEMKNICIDEDIDFAVLYSNIQLSKQELINYKGLFEKDLQVETFIL